ncbi:hypothetical protein TNCV_2255941 [Trichonephila clavipes]|nr:hypothetical protein TNCV_2255941 [Trichonephila clavipes]
MFPSRYDILDDRESWVKRKKMRLPWLRVCARGVGEKSCVARREDVKTEVADLNSFGVRVSASRILLGHLPSSLTELLACNRTSVCFEQ